MNKGSSCVGNKIVILKRNTQQLGTCYFFHVITLPFITFGPTTHKFSDSIRIKYFRLELKPSLHR
jgi:hypothetical protein